MTKYENKDIVIPIDKDNISITFSKDKCVECGMCKNICCNEITVGKMYDLKQTNDDPVCINCGQCANICPVDAICERYHYKEVKEIIKKHEKIVIISTAPAVRVALTEEFENKIEFEEGKMVALLKELGANYVLDVTFGADMTIIEEAAELTKKLQEESNKLPQFTSCCPAWVKYVEIFYPEFIKNLSTTKSPIAMQGITVKNYFAQKMGINPKDILHVVIAPCTAKKYEINREEFVTNGLKDTDYVLTTRELIKLVQEENINFAELKDASFDSIMGKGSGAGLVFGASGGVAQAVLRTVYYNITNSNPPDNLINLVEVQGLKGVKEATVNIGDKSIKVCVIQGMSNAKRILDSMNENEHSNYDFIEVMACTGGCAGGGGQPKLPMLNAKESKQTRMNLLYENDSKMQNRFSYLNFEALRAYSDFYGEPLGEKAQKMLHTKYENKSYFLGK